MINYIIANWWNFTFLHMLICGFLFFMFTLTAKLRFGDGRREEARRALTSLALAIFAPLLWFLYLPGLTLYWGVHMYREATQGV